MRQIFDGNEGGSGGKPLGGTPSPVEASNKKSWTKWVAIAVVVVLIALAVKFA